MAGLCCSIKNSAARFAARRQATRAPGRGCLGSNSEPPRWGVGVGVLPRSTIDTWGSAPDTPVTYHDARALTRVSHEGALARSPCSGGSIQRWAPRLAGHWGAHRHSSRTVSLGKDDVELCKR